MSTGKFSFTKDLIGLIVNKNAAVFWFCLRTDVLGNLHFLVYARFTLFFYFGKYVLTTLEMSALYKQSVA